MSMEEEILDLPEPKSSGNEFKWLRYLALFFFILALLFRLFRWYGQLQFLFVGVVFFVAWAVMKFLYAKSKNSFEWMLLTGRVGLALGLTFRFIYNFQFSPYLVYASIAILMSAYWIQSRNYPQK